MLLRPGLLFILLFFYGREVSLGQQKEKRYTGGASYYAKKFEGRKTANGEWFSNYDMTCAHRTFRFHTFLKVTNENNRLSTIVRVNDRGPYAKNRIIDLSEQGARIIGSYQHGVSRVKIEVIKPVPLTKEMDSLFNASSIVDCLGNSVHTTGYCISIWKTRDFEHALLLSNHLYEQDYVHTLFIGKTMLRNRPLYQVLICNIASSSEAKTLKDFWERKGFMKVEVFEKL